MRGEAIHYSSENQKWATPQFLVDACATRYGKFLLDPAASAENHKAPFFFTEQDNGLAQQWFGNVFVNPPYGRTLKHWVRKMATEAHAGRATVTGCFPARTDTEFFQEYAMRAVEVLFLRSRIHFIGANDKLEPAPFPTAIVHWRGPLRAQPNAPCFVWDLRKAQRAFLQQRYHPSAASADPNP